MSANNLLKKKSVIYDKDAGGVYKKKLRKIFTSNDPEMNPHQLYFETIGSSTTTDSSTVNNNITLSTTATTTTATGGNNHHNNGHEHHDITVKPYYNIGDIVTFRERSQTVDQIGFVYHKKASSLHEKERIPKCVVYMLHEEKYWVLEWLLMKENNIEVGERTFESSDKSSPPPLPPLNTPSNSMNPNPSQQQQQQLNVNSNGMVKNNLNQIVHNSNNTNIEMGTTTNNGHTGVLQNSLLNSSLMTSRFGHYTQNNNSTPTNGFLHTNAMHYNGISKSNKTSSSSVQLSQHLSSLLSSLDSSKFSNNPTTLSFDLKSMEMDEEEVSTSAPFPTEKRSLKNDPFPVSSSNQIPPPLSGTSITTNTSTREIEELLLMHPFLNQKNNSTIIGGGAIRSNNSKSTEAANCSLSINNINSSTTGVGSAATTGSSSSSSLNINNINNCSTKKTATTTTMEKLAQFNLFSGNNNSSGGGGGGSDASGTNGLHHSMNSMRRIPSNGSIAMSNMGNMNQLFTSDVNDENSQLQKQMVLHHIQQRQQLVNQQLMELLNQQNRRPMSSFSIPSSKYDLNLLNIANNYQYNITPSYGPYSQPAIVSFNHNFELRPTDMLQFLIIQVKDGQNLKASCVNPVISYDNDTIVALNDLSNRVALSSNGTIPNLDEELSKFVHSSPLLVTLPQQEEPSNVLIVLMKNFIPITSPLLFEYTP